jgi:hypothetical protein
MEWHGFTRVNVAAGEDAAVEQRESCCHDRTIAATGRARTLSLG